MSHPLPTSACPDCGAPLPPEQSLCPACLMRQALASRTLARDGDKTPQLPPPSPEEIADRFPGYEILECLGRGGMGAVYKARQKSLNRLVAIKILAPERVGEGRFAERFTIEAELLAKLGHPHIVTIHDFGETGGLFYLVMEFIDGVNLRDLLREGKMESEQALAIVPPICDALQYAHDKGIVHRDIKPENILLDRDGRVKIADFGIASLVGASGENSGTPPYMAPEQSGGTVDRRTDIYALGVVLYEMLTGERPEKDLVAPSKRVEVSVKIDEMVLRALEKEPERRYQTAEEFRTVLKTLRSTPVDDGISGAAASEITASDNRRMELAGIIAVVIVAVAALFFWAQQPRMIDERAVAADSPDEMFSATGRTYHAKRIFDADRTFYQFQVRGRNGAVFEQWEVPVPHEKLASTHTTLSRDEILFGKHGRIVWLDDGKRASFQVKNIEVAAFDVNSGKPTQPENDQARCERVARDFIMAILRKDVEEVKALLAPTSPMPSLVDLEDWTAEYPATLEEDLSWLTTFTEWLVDGDLAVLRTAPQPEKSKSGAYVELKRTELGWRVMFFDQAEANKSLRHYLNVARQQVATPKLEADLRGQDVTDEILAELAANKNLKRLNLYNSSISDEGLERLSGLRQVEKLILGANLNQSEYTPTITDAGIKNISSWQSLRNLLILNLPITDQGLSFLRNLRELETLNLFSTKISGSGLSMLPRSLRVLILDDTPITDEGMRHLSDFHQLERLRLNGTRVTDEGMKYLVTLSRLEELHLGGTEITDEGMSHLITLNRLEKLNLNGTKISDESLKKLAMLPSFRELSVIQTKVSVDGLREFQKARPEVQIIAVSQRGRPTMTIPEVDQRDTGIVELGNAISKQEEKLEESKRRLEAASDPQDQEYLNEKRNVQSQQALLDVMNEKWREEAGGLELRKSPDTSEKVLRVTIRKPKGEAGKELVCLVEGEEVDFEELGEHLKSIIERDKPAAVEIACEPEVIMKRVMTVVGTVKEAGVDDVRFIALSPDDETFLIHLKHARPGQVVAEFQKKLAERFHATIKDGSTVEITTPRSQSERARQIAAELDMREKR